MEKSLDVELPSGATAKFRDPKALLRGQRKVVQAEMLARGDKEVTAAEALDVSDTLVVTLLESWSFGFELVRENLDLLPGLDSDKLMVEAGERVNDYWLNIGPTPDPKAPTAPSVESGGSSPAEVTTTDSPSPLSSVTTS